MRSNAFGFRRARAGVTAAALLIAGSALLLTMTHRNAGAARQDATGFAIYRGDSEKVSGIVASDWGSGHIVEDKDRFYSGTHSLKIDTQGLFQGARLGIATPADLGPYTAIKSAYLTFALRLPGDEKAGTGRIGGPGRFGSAGGFGSPGGRGGSGAPPRGAAGKPGNRNNNNKMKETQDLKNLRFVFETTGGKSLEMLLPISIAGKDGAWSQLSIPVPAIPGLAPDDAKIQAIYLFGDAPCTLYVGQIGVVVDGTPISVERPDPVVYPKGTSHQFAGHATAGRTPLRYTWDFDVSQGVNVDAEGRVVDHTYYRSGDFVAMLTVSDYFGFKAPATTKFQITVTP